MATFETTKDPDAVLDYQISWADWLPDGDTIETSEWETVDGITIETDSATSTAATVWLSGGTPNDDYDVTNHIVTAGARVDDRTILVKVRER